MCLPNDNETSWSQISKYKIVTWTYTFCCYIHVSKSACAVDLSRYLWTGFCTSCSLPSYAFWIQPIIMRTALWRSNKRRKQTHSAGVRPCRRYQIPDAHTCTYVVTRRWPGAARNKLKKRKSWKKKERKLCDEKIQKGISFRQKS